MNVFTQLLKYTNTVVVQMKCFEILVYTQVYTDNLFSAWRNLTITKDKNCPKVSTILEVCSQILSIVQQSNGPDTQAIKRLLFVSPSNITLLTTDIYKESTVKCKTAQMVVHMPKIPVYSNWGNNSRM